MPVAIRPAGAADVPDLFRIRTSVEENHLSVEQMAGLGITAASVTAMIVSAPCAWVATEAGLVVGFSMVDLEEGLLFAAFVQPSCEGRGIGRRLVEAAEAALFCRHARILLETGRGTRAFGFYRRLGWGSDRDIDAWNVRLEKERA